MKRGCVGAALIALVASLLTVGVTASPAHAVDRLVVVDGFDYPAGLEFLAQGCTSSDAPPDWSPIYLRGGQRGTHATGRDLSGPGGMAGVEAWTPTPRTLTSIGFATNHPTPEVAPATPEGMFTARFDPSGNNFQAGYYVGYYPLNSTVLGWSTWSNLQNADLTWWWWTGTAYVPAGVDATIAQFANTAGTNGSGAWIGFEFGCDGRDYYLDDFRIATATGTTTYDFEGARSKSTITARNAHHGGHWVPDIRRLSLVQGQSHYLLGDSVAVPDGAVSGYLSGTARLYRKSYGQSTWVASAPGNYDAHTFAAFFVRPAKQTSYQVRTVPNVTCCETSSSLVLVVTVQRRLRTVVADTRLRRGQRIVVTGNVLPRDTGIPIVLQRRVGKTWRVIASTRTGRSGTFALRVKANTTGKWVIRLRAASGKGNTANVSKARTITVVKPPPRRKRTPEPAPVRVIDTTPVPPDAGPPTVVDLKRLQPFRRAAHGPAPVQGSGPIPWVP